jgi:hypothetical protein
MRRQYDALVRGWNEFHSHVRGNLALTPCAVVRNALSPFSQIGEGTPVAYFLTCPGEEEEVVAGAGPPGLGTPELSSNALIHVLRALVSTQNEFVGDLAVGETVLDVSAIDIRAVTDSALVSFTQAEFERIVRRHELVAQEAAASELRLPFDLHRIRREVLGAAYKPRIQTPDEGLTRDFPFRTGKWATAHASTTDMVALGELELRLRDAVWVLEVPEASEALITCRKASVSRAK